MRKILEKTPTFFICLALVFGVLCVFGCIFMIACSILDVWRVADILVDLMIGSFCISAVCSFISLLGIVIKVTMDKWQE